MTRRSPWGSVRRLPSGRFRARYRVGAAEHLAPETFSTARQAHAFLATTRSAIEHGAWIDVDATTVLLADYATRWLRERALLRPRTSELYECLLRLHILPTLGPVQERSGSYPGSDASSGPTPAHVDRVASISSETAAQGRYPGIYGVRADLG